MACPQEDITTPHSALQDQIITLLYHRPIQFPLSPSPHPEAVHPSGTSGTSGGGPTKISSIPISAPAASPPLVCTFNLSKCEPPCTVMVPAPVPMRVHPTSPRAENIDPHTCVWNVDSEVSVSEKVVYPAVSPWRVLVMRALQETCVPEGMAMLVWRK